MGGIGRARRLPQVSRGPMLNLFMAGSERVRWELTQVEPNGLCRLAVHHHRGVIVEYFATAPEALTRVQELEDMLSAIGAHLSQPTPVGLPS